MTETARATDLAGLLRSLDAEEVRIRREGHATAETLRRLTHERLAAHAQRRRVLLGLYAAMAAVAATDKESA